MYYEKQRITLLELDICPNSCHNEWHKLSTCLPGFGSPSQFVCLWVISWASNQFCPKRCLQLFPKAYNELCSTIRNDCLGYPMQANNAIEIGLSILLGSVSIMYRNEMCRLGESIHDNPNGIVLLGYVWQSQKHDSIWVIVDRLKWNRASGICLAIQQWSPYLCLPISTMG